MTIVRKSLAILSAAAMLASATVASASSIRPSDSLVSSVSASSASAVSGVRRNATLDKANHATSTTWVLTFIVVGTVVIAIWVAVDSDDEPESP